MIEVNLTLRFIISSSIRNFSFLLNNVEKQNIRIKDGNMLVFFTDIQEKGMRTERGL
jgi:hypothetical protein